MADVKSASKIKMPLESGDILFYRMNGSLTDRIISWYTKSPYVHVAIALDSKNQIEARANGVIRTVIPIQRVGAIFHLDEGNAVPKVNHLEITKALVWLNMQVGREYSWPDIANAVLEKWYHRFYMVQLEHYDCSALAAEFLVRAGYKLLLNTWEPQQITPAILANRLKLYKGWEVR